ncbi:MAG: disulfide bond formation protein B, partial [Sphingomonadales bacterium]
HPCEMCHWQRWPHYAAVVLAALAFAQPRPVRPLVLLAAMAIFASGAIGLFHAGVEYGWWEGLTRCATTSLATSGADLMRDIMATPLIRCDVAQWTLFGISLAGFNALFSIGGAAVIGWLWTKRSH